MGTTANDGFSLAGPFIVSIVKERDYLVDNLCIAMLSLVRVEGQQEKGRREADSQIGNLVDSCEGSGNVPSAPRFLQMLEETRVIVGKKWGD